MVLHSYNTLAGRRTETALTPREEEIAGYLCQGVAPRKIASLLGISVGTLRKHRANIYRKTGAGDLVGLLEKFSPKGRMAIQAWQC